MSEEISKWSNRSASSPDLHGSFGYMRCLGVANIQKQAHKKHQMEKQKEKRQKNGYLIRELAGFIQISMRTGTFSDLFRGIWIFQECIGFEYPKSSSQTSKMKKWNLFKKIVDKWKKNCYIIRVACESDTGTLITEQRIQEYNQK